MARVLIATQSWSPVTRRDVNGVLTVQAAKTVNIKNTDGTAATTWTAQSGGSSTTAALTTDSSGLIPNYIDEGEYDLVIDSVTQRVEATSSATTGRKIGDGPDPNAALSSDVAVTVTSQVPNPNSVILQHIVGYSFYTGTPGGSSGSLQGASFESDVFASPSNITPAVLGCELIGRADGDTGKTVTTVIGGQTSASAANSVTVTDLIGFRASGPAAAAGAPTVTNAYSLQVQAPTAGTNKYSAHITGRTRLKLATLNPLEIVDASSLLQWAVDSSLLMRGYASDGSSSRIIFDPTDGATYRGRLIKQGAANVNLRLDSVPTPTGNFLEVGLDTSTIAFSIDSAGIPRWNASANQQTTVGAAGGGSAPPATPVKYLKVKDSAGTTYVVAAYNP